MNKILTLLCIVFVLFSFSPTVYEFYHARNLPKERAFELVHNYVFDYNFYLSRIREGQEGRILVVEKYYNQPHKGSLLQILYPLMGKIGMIAGFSPVVVYHGARVVFGLILLLLTAWYVRTFFVGIWALVGFLFVVTLGSWPILVKLGGSFRFATYMGWWSVIDSLQRITFIPHVLVGQIFLLFLIAKLGRTVQSKNPLHWVRLGIIGCIAGIIFPPSLIVLIVTIGIQLLLEFVSSVLTSKNWFVKTRIWMKDTVIPRFAVLLLSVPSLVYLSYIVKFPPWTALPLFDIKHRSILPYQEYALALGPILPFGILGCILVLIKAEKKLFPLVAWVLSIGLLFLLFEHVPQQSPTRFTEAVINIPLGILAAYFFSSLWSSNHAFIRKHEHVIRVGILTVVTMIILVGFSVMGSMVLWLTDQARWKGEATWAYPSGTQLVYPTKDFMDGIYFLRANTKHDEVVLAFEAAGNYIPAYSGNFVFFGHANTPDLEEKEAKARLFFSGKIGKEEGREFLARERISYIFFGPQERDIGGVNNLTYAYPFLSPLYINNHVTIYKIKEGK